MTATLKPLNIFAEAYGSRFWQQHALVEGDAPKIVAYVQRASDTGKISKSLAPPSAQEAASMREQLLAHIKTGKLKKNPGALLVASSNVSRFNRSIAAKDPISQALLLQSPRGAKAASHLIRMLENISAKDLESAKNQMASAQSTNASIQDETDPDILREKVLDLFDADLARIMTKYEKMETWSQGAIAFAEYAQERAGGSTPFAPEELRDMRALRSQLQRSAQAAKQELSDFHSMYQRVASTMMLFTKVTTNLGKPIVTFPLVVPNLIAGGTFLIHNEAQAQLFAGIFEQVLGGIEDVQSKSVNPRLAELTEAQGLLGRALRGRSGSPPPLKL